MMNQIQRASSMYRIVPSILIIIRVLVVTMIVNRGYGQKFTLENECVCPGCEFILVCKVNRGPGESTIWRIIFTGTEDFGECSSEIQFRHNDIPGNKVCGSFRFENHVEDGIYISRLEIDQENVTSDLIGTRFICEHDNANAVVGNDTYTLSFTNPDPLPPPNGVGVTCNDSGRLCFNWEMVAATNCCLILYKISASGCGDCPLNATTNSVECSGLEQGNQQCSFSVLTSVCGVDGNFSEPLIVPLQVSSVPEVNSTISTTLIVGNNTEPLPSGSDLTTAIVLGVVIPLLAILILLAVGMAITMLLVTLWKKKKRKYSPDSRSGPGSSPLNHVELSEVSGIPRTENPADSKHEEGTDGIPQTENISEDQADSEHKELEVDGIPQTENISENQADSEHKELEVDGIPQTENISEDQADSERKELEVDGIPQTENISEDQADSEHEVGADSESAGLKKVDKYEYKLFQINQSYELRQFFKDQNIPFNRGCSYYEFKTESEDIDKDTKIILINKDSGEYFSGEKAREMIGVLPTSEGSVEVARPESDEILKSFRVFVQDRGPGSRHLREGSQLLVHLENFDLEEVNLTERFHRLKVEVNKDCELLTFIDSHKHIKPYKRGNAFYEFSHKSEDISRDKEVLLMDVKTEKLYTGRRAKVMIGAPGKGIRNPYADKKRYRVFVRSNCTGNRHLDGGTSVLYEKKTRGHKKTPSNVSSYLEEVDDHYEELKVTEDCSLRKFIEGKPWNKKFARGCAYYELTNDNMKDDVDSEKQVILMDKKGKLHRGQGAQMKIGAPGLDIGNPNNPHYPRVFIQSLSPGYSVHVRQGTSVIYMDPNIDLKEVSLDDFHRFDIERTCELRQFVIDRLGEFERGHAHFQFTCSTEDIKNDKEVFLMDKKTGRLFGGAAACCKIGAPGIGIPRPAPDFEYTVFVQNNSCGSRCLIKGSVLLYKK